MATKQKVEVKSYTRKTKRGTTRVKRSRRKVEAAIGELNARKHIFNRDHVVSKEMFSEMKPVNRSAGVSSNQVQWLADKNGDQHLLKQNVTREQVLSEVVSSFACKQIGIPCNEVRHLPRGVSGEGMSTLHKAVEGGASPVEETHWPSDDWGDIKTVRHPDVAENPFQSVELGVLERGEIDYTSVLEREDTSKIMALDIFFGNPDRHGGNVLYSKETDQYTAIDNGLCISRLSSETRRDAIGALEDLDPDKLNPKQKENLKVMRDTLSQLTQLTPSMQNVASSLTKSITGRARSKPNQKYNTQLFEARVESLQAVEILDEKLKN